VLEYPKQRSKQPQAAAPIRQSGIGRGIFVSIDRNFGYVNGVLVPANNYGGTGLPPLAPGPAGIGNNTTGALVDRRLLVDGPLAATAPWTIAVTLSATANVSLSHIFGFGLFYSGTSLTGSSTGQCRAILNYLNNYYWWGETADWNTGVAFDIDGIVRTIVFAHDGTNIYFYRAGVLAGSTARPAGVSTTPAGRYAVLGNKHSSGTNSPSATIYNGRAWNRCLTASEVVEYSGNPNCVYAPRPIWVPVSDAGGSVTGTSATTNANDTSTASGTTTVVGTSATTNANDTATASGSVGGAVTGTSATTNANDTSSASGTTTVTGTVAYSNANDSAAASGWAGSVSGTAAVTNANDTAQASGTVEGGATDTHDGFWSREWAKLKKREEKKPTIAEVVEIVKESPQVLEVVRAEVVRKYPQVNYAEVRENVQLQRFIAKQLIEAAEEEDDIEAMLLMA